MFFCFSWSYERITQDQLHLTDHVSIDIERRLPTTDGQQNSWSRQEPTSFRAWVACENKSYRLRKFLSTCILNSDMALFFLSLVDNLQRFFLPHTKRIRWFPFIQVEDQRTSINNISIPTCFFFFIVIKHVGVYRTFMTWFHYLKN